MATAGRSASRRRREPDRRTRLAAAAADQFYRRGYHGVALSEVAASAGVTAPAVYRHFRNKQALLAAAILSGLDVVNRAADEDSGAGRLRERFHALAGAALERRDLWLLLQREIRFVTGDPLDAVRRELERLLDRVAEPVRLARPDLSADDLSLVVAAVLAVLAEPSMHHAAISRGEHQRVLGAAALAAARMQPVPAPGTGLETTTRRDPRHRGEQLLETAIELFHEHGYPAVSLDEIGAAVGIAGPSVYHHFSTKAELLTTAFERATERLTRTSETVVRSGSPEEVLTLLVRGYTGLGVRNRALFGVYVMEAVNLQPEVARRIRGALKADMDDWVTTLARCRPGWSRAECLVRVGAARSVVNDLVRVGRFHERADIAAFIEQIALAVLLDAPTPNHHCPS